MYAQPQERVFFTTKTLCQSYNVTFTIVPQFLSANTIFNKTLTSALQCITLRKIHCTQKPLPVFIHQVYNRVSGSYDFIL